MREMLPHSVRPTIGLLFGLVLIAGVASWVGLRGEADVSAISAAGPIDVMAVDTDAAGNTATSLGTIDECTTVSGATGATATIDVVVDEIPAFDGTSGGIAGFGFRMLYDPTVLKVVDPLDTNQLLGANGLTPIDFSDARPDIDGEFGVALADFGSTTPESGPGVLARITVEVLPGAASGATSLGLEFIDVVEGDGIDSYEIHNVWGGRLSLDSPCPSLAPTPTRSPTPVPTPTPTPTPSPIPTPTQPPGSIDALGLGSYLAAPGDNFTIQVHASAFLLGAYRIDVRYDPALLEAYDCTSVQGVCSIDVVGPSTVRLNGASLFGITGDPVILGSVTFRVRGDAQGVTPLTIDTDTLILSDTYTSPLTVAPTDGQVSISGPTLSPTPTPVPTPQVGEAFLRVGSTEIGSGDEIEVEILADVIDLGAWRFDLHFDGSLLSAVDCQSSGFVGVCSMNVVGPDTVRINGVELAGLTGFGVSLGWVRFAADPGGAGTSPLTIDPSTLLLADTSAEQISGVITNGEILVTAPSPTPPGFTFSPPPPTPGPTVTSTATLTPTATAAMTATATPGPTSVPTATPTQTVSPGPSFTPGSSPEVPPLHVTIGEVDATLTKRRVLVITGEVGCSEPATVTIVGHVEQRRGKKSIGGVFVAHGVQCDGPTDWEARVFGGGRRFKEGLADLRLAVLAFGDGQVVSESQDLTVEIEKEKAKGKGKGNGSVAHWFGAVWR